MNAYQFRGQSPVVSPGAWVAPSAILVGGVRLDDGVSVWFGAVIRADCAPIEVGAGTNVQDNCVLHTDAGTPLRLGRNVSVGHSAILHGCTVEDDVLVGLGAKLMNGSIVGAGSLVAAGALVTAGTQVPAGSLVVGAPARVVRQLRDEEAEEIKENAQLYGGLAREWQLAESLSTPLT